MNTANDALNDALGSGDKLAISRASTAKWDEIRRDIAADALRGPSEWTPPSSHRARGARDARRIRVRQAPRMATPDRRRDRRGVPRSAAHARQCPITGLM